MAYSKTPTVIIIGAGPSGIATAHKLKTELGFNDFLIYEKLPGPGGTWMTNRYPGCGCDIPSHLYTFSFNLNPNWSQDLVGQEEILQYMNDTIDKFELREHMRFEVECTGATWDMTNQKWQIHLRDVRTDRGFDISGTVVISAVGAISYPKKVKFPGMENFQGKIVHTAEWDTEYSYHGKRMAVIGNGCSAAQLVPSVVKDVSYLMQYARGSQWYHERPNRNFSATQMWAFKHIPLYNRLFRFWLFAVNDSLAGLYAAGPESVKHRNAVEIQAKEYIYDHTPPKYHSFIAPDFPLGCKRRIWDPGYLDSLWEKNMHLVPEGIQEFDKTGIISTSGVKDEFDIIVTATGFEVTNFLVPMTIIGAGGRPLSEQWDDTRGPQAYYGCFVHDFPNFAMLFGPNTFPAHNSALFAIETAIEFISKSMLAPIVDQKICVVDVKHSAEERFVARVQSKLNDSVYEAGCSNWFVNDLGKNVTSWPGYAVTFYRETFFPKYNDFNTVPGTLYWPLTMIKRWLRTRKIWLIAPAILGLVGLSPLYVQILRRRCRDIVPLGVRWVGLA
ncbi:monooxygenase [Ilyonectria sp. MPI-CAGE-AT-0026]|nr:monooxygenase [Ilyonectria sp. MPI-CAGE-AT-0026]